MPLRPRLPQGWYLIYWRAISVDGHPVQGAFTYAVGPNPGPAPQFPVPKVSATAATPQLLIARWVMFLSVMIAIGLFVLRMLIARPMIRRVDGSTLRAVSVAFVIASVLGLIAIPVYLDFSTANDSLRSVFDLAALVPLFRVTAFGRAIVDLEVCFALFCLAAWISLWVDRPDREHRSLAELIAALGALLAAAAVLIVPGAAGHAATDVPARADAAVRLAPSQQRLGLVRRTDRAARALADAAAETAGRGALGRRAAVLERRARLGAAAGRQRRSARRSTTCPAINALWETGFGQAILVKTGLLAAAMMLASVNLLRSKPQLAAAGTRPDLGNPAAGRLRALVSGEAAIVTAVVFAAAVLTSLAPPPPTFSLENSAAASVGPGRVAQTVRRNGYVLQVLVTPNKAAAPDSFALRITKNGQLVRGANVTLTFNHTEMQMPQQEYQLTENQPGVYSRAAPALVMVGKWALAFQITPKNAPAFTALILDQANG